MPKQVQLRRGSTAQHATFTGAVGEVTVDTDKDTVVVHDGSTVGGFPLARADGQTFTGTITLPSTTSIGNVSSTELGYLDGVTSAIQTQINAKAGTASPTFTGDATFANVVETVYNLSGTAIDASNGNIQYKTIGANTTFTDSLATGESVILRLASASSYTITWPTMTWIKVGGTGAPTLTASDVVVLWKEGSTLYGAYVGSGV